MIFNGLCLYLLKIPKPDDVFFQTIVPKLASPLRNKIFCFRHISDQWRALLSDLLVKKIFSQELGQSPSSVKVEVGPYGKPFLQGKEREFNLSHAEDYILFITDNKPVGVDIEYIRPLNDLENLVQTCFSQKEIEAYKNKSKDQQLEFFYEIWTLKESYIKALGKGMSCRLQSFSVTVSEAGVFLEEEGIGENSWYFKKYDFIDQYKISVCASHCHFPEQPQIIFSSDLLELL